MRAAVATLRLLLRALLDLGEVAEVEPELHEVVDADRRDGDVREEVESDRPAGRERPIDSNTPKNPGALGTATPIAMRPCSRSAPPNPAGMPTARNAHQNARPLR